MIGALYGTPAAAQMPLAMPSTAPAGPSLAQKAALLQTAGATSAPSAAPDWETWASSGNSAPPASGGSDASAPMSSGGSSSAAPTDAGYSGSAAPGGMTAPDAAGIQTIKNAIADPTAGQGSTSTTSGAGGGLGSQIMGLVAEGGQIAAGVYGGPLGGLAAGAFNATLEPAIFGKA